jgi:hypothetical protein
MLHHKIHVGNENVLARMALKRFYDNAELETVSAHKVSSLFVQAGEGRLRKEAGVHREAAAVGHARLKNVMKELVLGTVDIEPRNRC